MSKKVRVGIAGVTGYSGEEALRILAKHKGVEVTYVSGREERTEKIQEIFPYLKNSVDLPCSTFVFEDASKLVDMMFLALPHTASMQVVPQFLKAGKKVIDISADYRLKDVKIYEQFYKTPHVDPVNLKHAVYGLPELNKEAIRTATLVANPGCFPTGAILGVLPGVKKGLFINESIGIDAKSGVTGAGRKAEKSLQFSEVNESFKAYKVLEHQHVPEMDQALSGAAGSNVNVIFVPHLLPINRGILSTIYVGLKKKMTADELIAVYRDFYKNEPFVNVFEGGKLPEIKHAAHSNFCHIGLRIHEARNFAVIVTAIDNLSKGAASQAVQNMNLMCGFDEKEGL